MKTRLLGLAALALTAPAFAQRGHTSGATHLPTHNVYRPRGATHLPTHRVVRPSRTVRVVRRQPVIRVHKTVNNVRIYNTRTPSIVVRPYRPTEWRRYYPNWRERYYYSGGRYYYDNAYRYPAVIDNEWSSIAALSGGVALLGAFGNDPYLTFGGLAGALYSYSRYQSDLHSLDQHERLRAAYFSHPYFWRNGVRYDRITVNEGGQRYYRFRRH